MNGFTPHRCDFCAETVRPAVAKSEPIMVRDGWVFLEGFKIGKCDRCGHAYFPAAVIKAAERAAQNLEQAVHVVSVPVVLAA